MCYIHGSRAAQYLSTLFCSTFMTMSRYLDIDSCIQAARLTAAAGEMAPFPFIKGAALCVVVTLENIQVC